MWSLTAAIIDQADTCFLSQSPSTRPVASLLIPGGGGAFSWTFSAFENWSSQWLSRETSIFKIITDDVTLWSKLKSTWFDYINYIS